MKVYEVFKKIQETAGTNDKKQILKENVSDVIKQIFEDTYGKQKYYIKKFDKPDFSGNLTLDKDYHYFRDTLVNLSERKVTGQPAYLLLYSTVADFDVESQEILCRIIDRNLKIGVSLDNFLDVVGGKEEKYEVALAESLSKAKGVDPTDGTYLISQKLDGVRCNCFITREEYNGEIQTSIKFKSRQGKDLLTLDRMKVDVNIFTQSLGCGEFVLDGEVCIVDENGKENFHGLMKEITRKDHTIERPKYKVFDILTVDEFWGRTESPIFSKRYETLCNLIRSYNDHIDKRLKEMASAHSYIDLVIQQRVTSQEILDGWIATAKDNGWEGCMLRKDAPYKRGRSKDLLKIKDMQDAEYEVIGIEFGTATYNEGGHKEFKVVSALKIVHKGNVVSVGSGLSKEQRLRWYEHPEEILGETVTIQYFEETKDSKTEAYSLRFPVLKYVYENGRDV
jgi:DNA ligase-1